MRPTDLGFPPVFGRQLQPPAVRDARHDLLERAILLVALSTVGVKWLTLGSLAGFSVEVSNFGTLVVISLSVVLILSRGWLRFSWACNILLITVVLILFSLLLHGDPPGLAIMSTFAIAGMYGVINCSYIRYEVVYAAFSVFMGFIVISIIASGSDFSAGIMEFMNSGNQGKFFFKIVRPIYNAFSPDFSDEKTTTLNNIVAGTSSLFFIMFVSLILNNKWLYLFGALLCMLINSILFSSTANITILFTIFVSGIVVFVKNRYLLIALLLITSIAVLNIVISGIDLNFLMSYLENESSNVTSRVDQYHEALRVIDDTPLLGIGLMEVDGYVIHNFVLFAFSSSGIIAGLLSLIVCLIAVYISLSGVVKLVDGRPYRPEYFLCACLPMLFMTRIMFGGGGGIPTDVGALALALSILAMREAEAPVRRVLAS